MTPMLLAVNGYPVDHGAALLKLRLGCALGTARKAMREAYAALNVPVDVRLSHGLRKVACDQVEAEYVCRPVSDANGKIIVSDAKDRTTDAAGRSRADSDMRRTGSLPREWSIELPGPVPPALTVLRLKGRSGPMENRCNLALPRPPRLVLPLLPEGHQAV